MEKNAKAGPVDLVVPPFYKTAVVASGPFHVYEVRDGLGYRIGPDAATVRRMVLNWKAYERELVVEVEENGTVEWFFEEVPPDIEMPDPTPIAIPAALREPPSYRDEIRRLVEQEVNRRALQAGIGSFEEEDDFEPVDSDELPLSAGELAALSAVQTMQEDAPVPAEGEVPAPVKPAEPVTSVGPSETDQ